MLMPGEAVLPGLSPAEIVMPGEMEMDHAGDMRGFMPLVGSRGNLTFSFTVPDKPGEWIYGCFQQSGQHFLNGMKGRSEEHTSELQSLMRISYAVFCLKNKNKTTSHTRSNEQ